METNSSNKKVKKAAKLSFVKVSVCIYSLTENFHDPVITSGLHHNHTKFYTKAETIGEFMDQ